MSRRTLTLSMTPAGWCRAAFFTLLLTAIAAACSAVRAGSLDTDSIPADACWVAHLDLDAAKRASWADLAGFILVSDEKSRERLETLRQATELDLLEDIHSVTFSGDWKSPEESVVIVRGKLHIEKLVEHLQSAPEYQRTEQTDWATPRTVHSMRIGEGRNERIHICFPDEATGVMCRNPDHLARAMAAISDDEPSLSDSEGKLPRSQAADGAVLELLVADLTDVRDEFESKHKSPVMRSVQAIGFTFGETPGASEDESPETVVELIVDASTPDAAADLADVVEGVAAVAKLHFSDREELLEAIRTLEIVVEGRRLSVRFAWPTKEVLSFVQGEILRNSK